MTKEINEKEGRLPVTQYKDIEFKEAGFVVDFIDAKSIGGQFMAKIKLALKESDESKVALLFIQDIKNVNGDKVAISTTAIDKIMETAEGYYLLDTITSYYYSVLAEMKAKLRDDFEKKYGKLSIG